MIASVSMPTSFKGNEDSETGALMKKVLGALAPRIVSICLEGLSGGSDVQASFFPERMRV